MKTILSFSLLMLFSLALQAQLIQNSDFETWTNVNAYEEPQGYYSTNLTSWLNADTTVVTRSADHHGGMYSARLSTIIHQGDTIFGLLTNGILAGNLSQGGVPYTLRADTLSVALKYQMAGTDSGAYVVMFKKQGTTIGMAYHAFGGTKATFTVEKTPVQWFVPVPATPDSMVFIAVSSNPDLAPVNGSYVFIDDVKLDGTLIPGGGFESWTMRSYEDAQGWNSFNIASLLGWPLYATKTTDAYSGTYAMKIRTTIINNGDDTLAHISNGRLVSDDYMGGMAIPYNASKLTGWYKYSPVGNDSALVALRAYGYDNNGQYINVDNNLIKLGAAATYTYFEIPLYYNAWPPIDTLGIGFASSNIYDGKANVHDGSILIIDSLNIILKPVGLEPSSAPQKLRVWPNPATDVINISPSGLNDDAVFRLFDTEGKMVISRRAKDGKINVAALPPGLYFYRLETGHRTLSGKINIIR